MTVEISRSLVEYILLGPTNDRRQLQDSPILGDVWIAFAKAADTSLDLLITPTRAQTPAAAVVAASTSPTTAVSPPAGAGALRAAVPAPPAGISRPAGTAPTAGEVAKAISDRVERDDANIAYLQGIVAARLDFEEVLLVVVPMTDWWHNSRNRKQLDFYADSATGPEEVRATHRGDAAHLSELGPPGSGRAAVRLRRVGGRSLHRSDQPHPLDPRRAVRRRAASADPPPATTRPRADQRTRDEEAARDLSAALTDVTAASFAAPVLRVFGLSGRPRRASGSSGRSR